MGLAHEAKKKSIRDNYFLKAFFLGLGLSFLVFLPFIVVDGGRFLFYLSLIHISEPTRH